MHQILIAVALAVVSTTALAQTQEQIEWCFGPVVTQDQRIYACTELIESAKESSATKAAAYHHRGFAYENKGWYRQAIADYTQAIALKADNAGAYVNRAAAYENIGLPDEAIADYRAALNLNPTLDTPRDALKRLGVTP